jgi:putative ABC transport system permease protein
MIGMFAVSYQKTRTRTKEIGIRKINGANIIEILAMINKDFIRWTVIAFIIAVPIAWYAMHIWLENYSYRTDVKWWIFALSGVIVLAISLLTISWQTLRAAMRNPVEALRYE